MNKDKSIDGLRPHQSKPVTAQKTTSHVISVAKKPTRTAPITSNTGHKKPVAKKSTHTTPISSNSHQKTTITPTAADASTPTTTDTSTSTPTTTDTSTTANSTTNDFLSPTKVFDFDKDSGELKASESTSTKTTTEPTIHKKEKKRMSRKSKVIISIIITIIVYFGGGATSLILWGNDIIAKITGGQGSVLDLITFVEPSYARLKTDNKGRTNILAFGTSGYNMDGDEGDGTHDGAQLTDSIMVISLNQDTGDIAMTSLPRDLKASPTCTATGKINEVYWCNGGGGDTNTETEAAAASALMNEVGDILGIDFQYYAHLNWGSLVQIVDILGGIEVTLDEDIYDYYWTGAVFDAGIPYTIDGEQALGLARARHGTTGGDFTRGASQQKILIGIKNKLLEKKLSISDLLGLASALGDNLRTNFSLEELKSLAHLLSEFDFDSMRQISLIEPERLMTTGTINGISYVIPSDGAGYYGSIQEYIAKMFSSDPRDYEDYNILVLNATETPGLAALEKTELEKAGYTAVYTDDAPTGEYNNGTTLYVIKNDAPGTAKMLEGKYQLQSSDSLPESVPRTYTFVIILNEETTNE